MNKEGYTPLLMAAKNGYISCARILFQQGQASLVARDPIGNLSVEELLEKNGVKVYILLYSFGRLLTQVYGNGGLIYSFLCRFQQWYNTKVDYFLKKKVIDKSKRKTLKENTSIEVF
jgi:ankyrin repeat protein